MNIWEFGKLMFTSDTPLATLDSFGSLLEIAFAINVAAYVFERLHEDKQESIAKKMQSMEDKSELAINIYNELPRPYGTGYQRQLRCLSVKQRSCLTRIFSALLLYIPFDGFSVRTYR
jgi:hypothetical protein